MCVEEELKTETIKWLNRLNELDFDGERDFVENINAYVSDARFFLEKNDLIRAFECIIWAWAWFEIGKRFGFVWLR